jgi:hypothetical protein
MTEFEIDQHLARPYSDNKYTLLFDIASQDEAVFATICDMIKKRPAEESWRLLWVLEHASEKNHNMILPLINTLYLKVLETKNESFIRIAMKLIMRFDIDDEYAGVLLERCIGWMHSDNKNKSTRVTGLEFFYRMCLLYPELSIELIAHIDRMQQYDLSAGEKVRIRQIIKNLHKKNLLH